MIGGIFYIWRRDPAEQRNGVMSQMAKALVDVAHVTERMNNAHEEYLHRMDDQDRRNREEHQAMLGAIKDLTNIIAPRRFSGGGD